MTALISGGVYSQPVSTMKVDILIFEHHLGLLTSRENFILVYFNAMKKILALL